MTLKRLAADRPPCFRRRLRHLLTLCLWASAASGWANTEPSQPTAPTAAEHEFHFVVLGDSQFHDPAGFNRIINDLVWLSPAFAVQVGDMIQGYANPEQVRGEWQRFFQQIGPLRGAGIPFLPVAGNHDVLGARRKPTKALKKLYEATWGATYYQFNYGNSAFIVLNTDEPGASSRIAQPQLEWLQQTLADSLSQQHRFVFMHRPPNTLRDAETLHALFAEHRVHTVFYGHHHHYHFNRRDNVQYIMTNAAANSATQLDGVGSFDHLLQVSVRDQNVRIAVIRADSVQAPDTVAPQDNYDLFALRRGLFEKPPLLQPQTTATKTTTPLRQSYYLKIALHNPSERDIRVYLHCSSADERWHFEPRALPATQLSIGARQVVTLEAWQSASAQAEGLPTCVAQFPYQLANGSWHNRSVSAQATLAQ